MNKSKTNFQVSTEQMAVEIKEIYEADPLQAESSIETYLNLMFKGVTFDQKMTAMKEIQAVFQPAEVIPAETSHQLDTNDLADFFSLLLGHEVHTNELSSKELMHRLSESLNTIFDSLNELVGAINHSILSDYSEDKTIRQIIGYLLGDERHLQILASYIGRIKQTFLITQQAFKASARTTVHNILKEFDPERIQAESEGKFGFGTMKKANYYNVFEKKYDRCKKWFESDRFMETFLREFEKNCQNMTKDSQY